MGSNDARAADMVMVGDDIALLSGLATSSRVRADVPSAVAPDGDRVRAVVTGLAVDGTLTTTRELKHALRGLRPVAMRWCRLFPRLRHILVVIDAVPGHARRRVLARCGAFGASLHTEIERAQGMYVAVTVIDATSCDDDPRLVERILEHIDDPAGTDPAIAVSWAEIRDASIRSIIAQKYS